MKKNVSKLLLAIVSLLSSTNVSAYDFEVDGLYYEVVSASDCTCKVVSNRPQRYAGNIAIPVTFSYDGTIWTVVEIGSSAFSNCEDLTSVVIPNSVTTIDKGAFRNCSSLISVTIPNSVITINESAFGNCTSLTNITIPNSVTTIGVSVFSGCTSLTNVTISNSIKRISFTLFSDCSSLTSITIPNSVISIDSRAFMGCHSLTSVTIGKSVNQIYGGVFSGCNALTTLYSLNTTPPNVDTDNFTYSQNMNINVYVPQEALSAYRNVEPWKSFKNLQSIEGTGQEMKKCTMPTIHYANNKLTFDCETEGVTFESKITDTDIASYSSNEIKLGATYNISVYATKAGYEDSDKATATLC